MDFCGGVTPQVRNEDDMTTAQTVFELAMTLMDEVNESTGKADTADTKEYKNRSLAILNILRVECFPYSDTYVVSEAGKRPVCPLIEDFVSAIGLDDGICQGLLPYGLAAHLLLGEDDEKAQYFQQRYEEKMKQLAAGVPTEGDEIVLPFGGIEFGQFARW